MRALSICLSLLILIAGNVLDSEAETNHRWGEIALKPISMTHSRYRTLMNNLKYNHGHESITAGKPIIRVLIRDDRIIVVENDDGHRDIISIYDLEGHLTDVYDIYLKEALGDTYHYIEYDQNRLLLLNGRTGYECIYGFTGDEIEIYQMDAHMADYESASERINAAGSPYQIVSIKNGKVEIRRPDGSTFILVDHSEEYIRVFNEEKNKSILYPLIGLITLTIGGIIAEIIIRQKEREGD